MRIPLPLIHRWRPLKWGWHPLDARECAWCGRFEVYAYGDWHRANRRDFPDARPA